MQTNYISHHGILGQKWGVRRFQNEDGSYTAAGKKRYDNDESESSNRSESKAHDANGNRNSHSRLKTAAKVGAAVAGTALAAYGTYKIAKFVQDKRNQKAMTAAQEYLNANLMKKIGSATHVNGDVSFVYQNAAGSTHISTGARKIAGKAAGQHNASVIATSRKMYKDATNTKLDRGLSKIVNAGNAVGNTVRRTGDSARSAGNAVRKSATNAKNRMLDIVKPQYEYRNGPSVSKMKTFNGPYGKFNYTETTTPTYRVRKRRV